MAIVGVAVGSAGLLIALSVVHGFKQTIESKILGFGTHISIETYAQMPVYRADTLLTWVSSQVPGVQDVQPVLYGQGMIQAGNQVEGTFVKGVPEAGDLSDLRTYITTGSYDLGIQSSGFPGLVMGARLARNLNATIGQSVFIYAIKGIPSSNNLPDIQQFTLTGIYQTGIDRFDDVLVLVPIDRTRTLFGIQAPAASQIDIRLDGISSIRPAEAFLRENMDFPYYTQTVYERYSNIFAWINLQEQTIPFVIGAMILVAAFNLIGTVLMMVLERVRDIGILKMMGTSDRRIRNIFLLEGFLVGFIGLALGVGIALLFNWLQAEYAIIPLSEENYYMSTAPVSPRWSDFVLVSMVTMSLCLAASWFPARVAARLNPLTVTRFGK